MLNIPALNLTDCYKTDHRRQFPDGLEYCYSNFTPRASRVDGVEEIVFFGLQYFLIEYLDKNFHETFFDVPREAAVRAYKRRLDNAFGPGAVPVDHVAALHDLGYLPLRIKALPEGRLVPLQVPCYTIENTDPRFGWLTNFIETLISCTTWLPCTSATTAFQYRRVFDAYAAKTGAPKDFVPWQGHDFSMRGMAGLEAACLSGAAHLLSFTGTDTLPAIDFLEKYYGADSDKELIGGSVYASEHAVMCAGGMETEEDTYHRMLTKVYPKGIVSLVSDTWDFWGVVTKTLPKLKDVIMQREGKLVIRPDSGDPVKIICGDDDYEGPLSAEARGLIQCLWDAFGGTINEKGYKVLDPHIGAIYGDSITLERQKQILAGLEANGFASCNVVLGIGSFTYQYVTRDTYSFAMKATWAQVNGEARELFKDPKTGSGKRSHRGLISVYYDNELDAYRAKFPVSRAEEERSALETVYLNGKITRTETLAVIRARMAANLSMRPYTSL
jgi:nicotinamide phosphoribosyltransferase